MTYKIWLIDNKVNTKYPYLLIQKTFNSFDSTIYLRISIKFISLELLGCDDIFKYNMQRMIKDLIHKIIWRSLMNLELFAL